MKMNRAKVVLLSESTGRTGFTLLELMVVLGVLAVLISLQLPALAVARGQTKMGVCASNIRQIALATQVYAIENNNRLPLITGDASFAWDLPATATLALLNGGAQTNNFYCPGTAPRFTDLQNWEDQTAPSRNLWNYGAPNFHVTGYAFAFSGKTASNLNITNQNNTMLPEAIPLGGTFMPAPAPAQRVLLADATVSQSSSDHQGPAVNGYDFNQVSAGFYQRQLTPHLNGRIPAGGNLGFKDGHVAWRNFQAMDERATDSLGFWW